MQDLNLNKIWKCGEVVKVGWWVGEAIFFLSYLLDEKSDNETKRN